MKKPTGWGLLRKLIGDAGLTVEEFSAPLWSAVFVRCIGG